MPSPAAPKGRDGSRQAHHSAPTGYLIIPEEPGLHVVATRFELTFDGDVVFSKNFGEKAGLTTFTCTQTFEDPDEGTGVFTLTVAVVPPQ